MIERGEGGAVGHDGRGVGADGVDAEIADVLFEARGPVEGEDRAGLKHRGHAPPRPAAHDAGVATVGGGERLDDRGAFAVATDRDEDAFVAPVHRTTVTS